MSKKLLGIVLIISVAINVLAAFALATYLKESRRPRPASLAPRNSPLALTDLKDRYALTDAQMDTMKALHEFRRDNVRPVRDRLDSLQAALVGLLQEPQLDQPRINTVMAGIVAAQETLETGAFQVLLRMRNVLTAEQLPQLRELFNDLQRAGQQPGDERRPGPGGDRETRRTPPREPGPGQPQKERPPKEGGPGSTR
jgi:Spy/CpxP family protein refolding chaperone